ncbi:MULTISPECIES: DNA circularization protein [Brenneria]|uniref:Multidrug DMT transporter permease n=1 Tax=Brenneria nigrifluens DSM 30175 = ATCC 13028 TaxID=1121120 RepID=A0A2U1USM0_9GAMM|nr:MULTISPECIES: DNA circularization N-terminal domain-containing protein [Brenneria]EHD21558.1 DNA circulation family protein [Brenneria sp. EniD312]PWC24656.1 multidrug DMT transporter permease [Brenneria nigrifluens DSM 30175 = ATCC 13028]QCR04678.1 multidrug DMT transporter permease [Brenneria nigrifluens DSM 30175 = ATCC 13028]
MSWADSLQEASFRGVPFDIINTRDSAQRDLAQHEYPYLNGADIQDLGSKPHSLQTQAVFWGDDYESRLQTFLEALRKLGSGDLIHPVFGSMPNMQVAVWQVNHDAENVDYCTVDIQFVQSKTGNPFFVNDYPLSKADVIFNKVQSLIDDANTLIEGVTKPLRTVKATMKRARAMATTALNMVTIFRSEITGFISSTTDFINYPSAFFSDLRSALSLKSATSKSSLGSSYNSAAASGDVSSTQSASSESDVTNYVASPAIIVADWSNTYTALQDMADLPVSLLTGATDAPVEMPALADESDIAELVALTSLAVSMESAQAASELLSDETIMAVLTPVDIEQIVNDARSMIQQSIALHRTLYTASMETISSSEIPTGLAFQPIINGLADIALELQQMGAALINQRPQLISRAVQAQGNLHLVAHLWYGDYSRADELRRLNPQLRDPNNLQPGDVLNAYAE